MKYELIKDLNYLTIPVPDFNFAIRSIDPLELGKNLLDTLYSKGGYGLAANQCGLPYRCFVMMGSPADFVCFNPTIINTSEEMITLEEGCLSFPGLALQIPRSKDIRIRFSTPDGERHTARFEGLTARCIIHEIKHLNGIHWFEGISRLKLQKAIRKAKKLGFDYEGLGLLKYCS